MYPMSYIASCAADRAESVSLVSNGFRQKLLMLHALSRHGTIDVSRLVIVLLETCGQYFGKGAVAKRLDRFLAHLQRYVLSKPPPPLDVSMDLEVLHDARARVLLNAKAAIGNAAVHVC
jgi:hypothetical protein